MFLFRFHGARLAYAYNVTLIMFVGLWLASYRVTRLIIKDTLFDRQRRWFFLRFPPDDYYRSMTKHTLPNGVDYWKQETAPRRKQSKLGQLFNCSWCLGHWIAGATVLVVANFTTIHLPILWWFAVSSAVGLTAKNLDG